MAPSYSTTPSVPTIKPVGLGLPETVVPFIDQGTCESEGRRRVKSRDAENLTASLE